LTPSITRTPSITATPSLTPDPTRTPSVTATPSITRTPSVTPDPTRTPSVTATPSITRTPDPTRTPSVTQTPDPTRTPSVSRTPDPTRTPSVTQTPDPTRTPSVTPTPSVSVPYVEPTTADLYFSNFSFTNAIFTLGTNNGYGLASSFDITWDVDGYPDDNCIISIESAGGSNDTFPALYVGSVSFVRDSGDLTCSSTHFQRRNPIYINGTAVFGGGTIVLGNTTLTFYLDTDCDPYAC
jgi:hypothetical protein